MRIRLAGSVALAAAVALLTIGGCAAPTADLGAPRFVECPAGPGSQAPNLAVGLDGVVYLSWIEPRGAGHALRFSTWSDGRWDDPRTVAEGDDWFVNWADFPSMAALEDGTLAAHWLVRSGAAAYAYDVVISLSRDGGDTWSEPFSPHRDATPTEHGFVSLVPSPGGSFDVIWLDGRHTADEPRGAMTLRYAALAPDGRLEAEAEIDPSVCDCCSTDALRTEDGTLLTVYRDRTASEIRDISVSRLLGAGWSAPATVHADDWEIAGCPVNGPAVASRGTTVAVAWFTAAGETARVQVAFSTDGGATFGRPLRVADGNPLGRVDVEMLDGESALVSWLEHDADRARIAVRPVTSAGVAPSRFVTETSQARSSGFPRMVTTDGEIILAWTTGDEPTRIGTAVISK